MLVIGVGQGWSVEAKGMLTVLVLLLLAAAVHRRWTAVFAEGIRTACVGGGVTTSSISLLMLLKPHLLIQFPLILPFTRWQNEKYS